MTLKSGKITALTGLTASGKTTLGLILKGFLVPHCGGVFLKENDTERKLPPESLNRQVGWAGAHPEIQIFAQTVREEIGFGLKHHGVKANNLEKQVVKALEMVGLSPSEYIDRNPFGLSGGKKRLIALASIASLNYDWYILDEPTAGLDLFGFRAIQHMLKMLADNGKGVCVISHDEAFLNGITDEFINMKNGKICV